MLFDAHTRSFAGLGGVARRGIYDNMRTAVDKVNKGKSRVVNTRFAAMASHYLFDADFCNVASGWEKGVVEIEKSRTPGGASGSTRRAANGVALRNSTFGWLPAVRLCGARSAIPNTSNSAWQKCWNKNALNSCPCQRRLTATSSVQPKYPAPAWWRWRATATRCRANWRASG